MTDFIEALNQATRTVRAGTLAGADSRTMILRREYQADVSDVWDACTDAARIGRWLAPVTGELKLGGNYAIEGNAHGQIIRCEPPSVLRVTWELGDSPAGAVEMRFAPVADSAEPGRTVVELEHISVVEPEFWKKYGPGAVGVGWDLGLLGLDRYLGGHGTVDNRPQPAELRDFMSLSSQAWGKAHADFGAEPDAVSEAVRQTTAFYTGG